MVAVNSSTCSTSDQQYYDLQYPHDIAVLAGLPGLFIFAVAVPLFVIVAVRRKLNWTISLLFLSTPCFLLTALFGTAFVVRRTPQPQWGYDIFFAEVFTCLGQFLRQVYLYRRCASLIPALTKRFVLRRVVHIIFLTLVVAYLFVNAANDFAFGHFVNVDGTNVWERFRTLPILVLGTLWLNSLVDMFSCVIVLASILITFHVRNPLGTKRHTLQARILDIVQASEFRIVLVLMFAIIETALFQLVGLADDSQFAEAAIVNNYMFAIYMILLLIDSSLMLLADAGGRAGKPQKSETFLVWDNDRNGWTTVDKSPRRGLPGTGLGAQQPPMSPGMYTTGRPAPSSPFTPRSIGPSRPSISPSDTPRTARLVNFDSSLGGTGRSNATDSPTITMTSLLQDETATQWGNNVLDEAVAL